MRKTKIICTLGPAVDTDEMIRKLIESGMDCARFNFSHGTHAEHAERMERVRRVSAALGKHIALLLDTKGPEIRLGTFENGAALLEKDALFCLDTKISVPGNARRSGVTYGALAAHVEPGTVILIDDGKIGLRAESIEGDTVLCRVVNGGKVSDRKSINIPGVHLPMPYISEADRADILFGIRQDVDFIAASFVRSGDDVRELRKLLLENGGGHIRIISKIENDSGVKNLEEIIALSDGIMVARGDLGVEIPFTQIPAMQKQMINLCNQAGKLVVTATQMLESMTRNPRPTRAEVSDVANAVYDGSDVIMLSGESAAGDYPAEAVRTMAEIAEATESVIDYSKVFVRDKSGDPHSIMGAVCTSARLAAEHIGAAAIITVTLSGATVRELSDYRPECPILAVSVSDRVMRQLSLEWGVVALQGEMKSSAQDVFRMAVDKAFSAGLIRNGDRVVVVFGDTTGEGSHTDMLRVYEVSAP